MYLFRISITLQGRTIKHCTGVNRTITLYLSSALENNTGGRKEGKVGGRRWMEVSVGLATAI